MNKTSAVQTIGILTSGGDARHECCIKSSSKNSMGKRY